MNASLTDVLVPRVMSSPASDPKCGVLTAEKLESIIETSARCAEDPLFDEWVEAVEEYRRRNNTPPDAD